MENKQKLIDIINNNSPELAAEEILLLFGINNSKCSFCGSQNITIESDGVWCCDCNKWENKKL